MKHEFEKGHKLATGRPKGSKNKVTLLKERVEGIVVEKITQTWEEKLEKYLPDDLLLEVLKEGLEAIAKKPYMTDEKDFNVRYKYLETALKIKRKIPSSSNVNVPIQINFRDEKEEYR